MHTKPSQENKSSGIMRGPHHCAAESFLYMSCRGQEKAEGIKPARRGAAAAAEGEAIKQLLGRCFETEAAAG